MLTVLFILASLVCWAAATAWTMRLRRRARQGCPVATAALNSARCHRGHG